MVKNFKSLLKDGDMRSVRGVDIVVNNVLHNQEQFGEVFHLLYESDPAIRMRAADSIEKISQRRPELLQIFKKDILSKVAKIDQQEIQWHVAQIIPRLKLRLSDISTVRSILNGYIKESRSNIVRVMSLQALADLAIQGKLDKDEVLKNIKNCAQNTQTPSIVSRAKKLIKILNINIDKTNNLVNISEHWVGFQNKTN